MAHHAEKQASDLMNQTCHHTHQGNKSGDYQSDKTGQTLREINLRIKSIYTLQGTSQVNKTILRKITTQFKEPIIVKEG